MSDPRLFDPHLDLAKALSAQIGQSTRPATGSGTSTATTFKARPTLYRGIQMRSRLEARVAAMFDAQGARWKYEPCAFAGPGREQYLPDFVTYESKIHPPDDPDQWCGGGTTYFEVKPNLTNTEGDYWMHRMEVIRDSQPDASLVLLLVDANESYHSYGWEMWDGKAPWYHQGPSGWLDRLPAAVKP